ncbi:cell division cycle-associated 7-like protein isoform X2 [Conger conger]|uniref:cell division cycle-associated 7-like protein isoform X2 n=1 Tax=Conger conger TaxID=82655 RepID=UPI002A59B039|nr:cell division cycle-associated 7-like protein isoform X2 [Conger conger]
MDVSMTGNDVRFKSKYITDELVRLFTEDTDTEDEEFEGFDEEDCSWISDGIKCMSEESEDSDEEDYNTSGPARRKSAALCVAFRFPTKKGQSQRKSEGKNKQDPEQHTDSQPVTLRARGRGGAGRGAGARGGGRGAGRGGGRGRGGRRGTTENVPPPQMNRSPLQTSTALVSESGNEDTADEDKPHALQKRANNIKENKAMLEKLLADLHSMPVLLPRKTQSVSSPKKRAPPKKGRAQGEIVERRNPTRSARPPANFGVEDFSISPTKLIAQLGNIKKAKLRARLSEVNQDGVKRRRTSSKNTTPRAVDDITEEELENVAHTGSDKIYDKEHGSTCHQCRQKTIDTKTVCRNPSCWGVRGQFCGPCLRNRYGEDVRDALLDSMWVCPPCRGICNCSFCRKADGRCATGILIYMAKFYGHSNVKEYLESLQKHLS